jgi:hypothetical protein
MIDKNVTLEKGHIKEKLPKERSFLMDIFFQK